MKKQTPACTISGNCNPAYGQYTTLCAPIGLSSYLWNTGSFARCIQVNKNGTYTVTTTNTSGCTNSCSVKVQYHSRQSNSDIINSFAEDNLYVNVYPNPFNSVTFVEFTNSEIDAHVVICLYDLIGNKLALIFDNEVEKGIIIKKEINADNFSEGVYILRIDNGDQVVTRKLILIKYIF